MSDWRVDAPEALKVGVEAELGVVDLQLAEAFRRGEALVGRVRVPPADLDDGAGDAGAPSRAGALEHALDHQRDRDRLDLGRRVGDERPDVAERQERSSERGLVDERGRAGDRVEGRVARRGGEKGQPDHEVACHEG